MSRRYNRNEYDQYGNQPQQQQRSGGPLGLLVKGVGAGVGVVAEYRAHRKEQKLSRENSAQSGDSVEAGPSNAASRSVDPDLPPPDYAHAVNSAGDRSIGSGGPAVSDKKAALSQYSDEKHADQDHDDDSDDEISSIEGDEQDWELDDLLRTDSDAPGLPTYDESEVANGNTDGLVREVLEKRSLNPSNTPSHPFVRQPLPCPVILPQRRPGSKDRGFVRAYAPLLGECNGIDQDTFLAFLKNFHKSSQASPAFAVVAIASGALGLVPEPVCQAISIVGQVAVGTGEEVQKRARTNNFLDKMNEELFKPAGLYAMIVQYKTQAEVEAAGGNSLLARFGVSREVLDINTNQTIAKFDRSSSSQSGSSMQSMSQKLQKLRLASGTTQGAIRLPESAPLVWPEVDKLIAKQGPETFKDKRQDAKYFLADYLDRRAQINYARNDPTSSLIVPEEKRSFRSKWADPNHPMFTGGPIGLLSGGVLNRNANQGGGYQPRRQRRDRRSRRSGRYMDNDDYYDDGYGDGSGYAGRRGPGGGRQRRGLIAGLVGGAIAATQNSPSNRPGAGLGRRSFEDRGMMMQQRRDVMMERREDMIQQRQDMMQQRRGLGSFGGGFGSRGNAAGYSQYDDELYARSQGREATGYDQYSDEYEDERYGGSQQDYGRGGMGGRGLGGGMGRGGGGRGMGGGMGGGMGRYGGRGGMGGKKRTMKSNVLYLQIVNLPSEAELAEARQQLAMLKQGR